MHQDYEAWLRRSRSADTTATQLSRVARVERHYGELEQHFAADRLQALSDALRYSSEDERKLRPNPTKIPLDGAVLRTSLGSYKSAVTNYLSFCKSRHSEVVPQNFVEHKNTSSVSQVSQSPKTLAEFDRDGLAAFESIIKHSQYGNVRQLVASLTLFSHPDTVAQARDKAIFSTVRDQKRVGQFGEINGRQVMFDDNQSPTDAFLWANMISPRRRDVQFNHVYAKSKDPDAYTALPNICMTPAFVAKLTDTSKDTRAMLRYRSYDLYGWTPSGIQAPPCPEFYQQLEWASPLDPVDDLETVITTAMASKPKSRTVIAAKRLGWLFQAAQG